MKIDLQIPSWNRPEMTELVVKTIHRNTKPGTYTITVFDHGSTPETQEKIRSLANEGLINKFTILDGNVGLEAARQRLFGGAEGDYFVCVDNDCLPPPMEDGKDWLERLVELMDRYEDFAAISMRTQVMIGTGNIFEEADRVGDDIVEFPHPGGSFRIMRTDAVKAVGGWDRGAVGRGAEERYICGKLREARYRTAFAVKVQCLHLFGDRNRTKERWGYKEGMKPEESGHSDIFHPALENGDNFEDVSKYTGEELARGYFND
jgi:GT2 family glycosyltransferase